MPERTQVQVDTTVLDNILKQLGNNRELAVRTVAFAVEGLAKEQIRILRAIDTGAMQNSVYTRTAKGTFVEGKQSSWGQIAARIRARRPSAQADELPAPREGEAIVGPSVEYALSVHYGGGRRGGRPFLENAVREAGRGMAEHFRRVVTNE